ncbi:MAG: hypothetical protein K9G33_07240, partial [Sneathiella sp.]|nr:hypothetical protein [Sneathiella sp.]
TGADALAPISTLGNDFFHFDPDKHSLVGKRTGRIFRLADRLAVRLREVDIVTGSMIVEVEDGRDGGAQPRRPANAGRPGRGKPSGNPAKKKKRTLSKGKKRARRSVSKD